MIIKKIACVGGIAALSLVSGGTIAATVNVGFNPAGAAVALGTVVSVGGSAGANGFIGGNAWDVALVLDSSGSMDDEGRQQLQHDAANALVGSLPSSTSVSIVEYDFSANVVVGLTPISTGSATVTNAINSVDASGGTDIRNGIESANNELTVPNNGHPGDPDPSRSQVMVVLSDGGVDSDSQIELTHNAAQAAIGSGVSQVHSVGIGSSHDLNTMQSIVSGADGIYNNNDDIGVYTDATDLSSLVALFSDGGALVGLDRIEITLPDGSVLKSANGDFSVGALGNFAFDFELVEGSNPFTALAFATDGSSATASIVYNTVASTSSTPSTPSTPSVPSSTPSVPSTSVPPSAVPVPAAVWLFGSGLIGLAGFKRRK